MPLINKKDVVPRETVSYKLDSTTVEMLKHYAEFIGSPMEHVVNQALLFIFKKDKDFTDWLALHERDAVPGADSDATTPAGGNRARGNRQ